MTANLRAKQVLRLQAAWSLSPRRRVVKWKNMVPHQASKYVERTCKTGFPLRAAASARQTPWAPSGGYGRPLSSQPYIPVIMRRTAQFSQPSRKTKYGKTANTAETITIKQGNKRTQETKEMRERMSNRIGANKKQQSSCVVDARPLDTG